MHLIAFFIVLVGTVLIHGPATAQTSPTQKQAAMQNHLAECTVKNRYDPEDAADLGANTLGAGERKWADCAYSGVRSLLAKLSLVPKAYEDLISRHQEMTDAIERGTITRNERREAIKAMIASIRNQEKAMFEAEVSMIKTMQDTIAMEQQLKVLDGAQNSILHRRRALGRMF